MSVFSEPFLRICNLRLTAERNPLFWKWISQQKLENQSLQIPGGVKLWKRDFEMQFKGPNFAKMLDQCAKCISWTVIRHHWLTKRSNYRFKRISRWSTRLGISHFRPFNTDFHGLYWRSHRQSKVVSADNKSMGSNLLLKKHCLKMYVTSLFWLSIDSVKNLEMTYVFISRMICHMTQPLRQSNIPLRTVYISLSHFIIIRVSFCHLGNFLEEIFCQQCKIDTGSTCAEHRSLGDIGLLWLYW